MRHGKILSIKNRNQVNSRFENGAELHLYIWRNDEASRSCVCYTKIFSRSYLRIISENYCLPVGAVVANLS